MRRETIMTTRAALPNTFSMAYSMLPRENSAIVNMKAFLGKDKGKLLQEKSVDDLSFYRFLSFTIGLPPL